MKKEYRIKFQKLRNNELPKVEELIIKRVGDFIHSKPNIKKKFIGIYWPLAGEIDLRILKTKELGIPLALPSANNLGILRYHPWGEKQLKKDFYGIPSPIDEKILTPNQISLLLVPAIAIDQDGYRLGYGGGFFDRLRSDNEWKKITSLVVLPNICVSDTSLPKDTWDIPFDGWISEKGLFRTIKR